MSRIDKAKQLLRETEKRLGELVSEAVSAGEYDEAVKLTVQAKAVADQLNITITAQGMAFFEVATQLGLNQTEILTYMFIQAIMEHDESLLIIGDSSPLLNIDLKANQTS